MSPHSRARALAAFTLLFPLLLPLFLQLPAVAQAPSGAPAPSRARITSFVDSVVNASMSSTRTPGVSVAVVRGTDTLVLKGYGFADIENRVPVTTESVFRVGSLTKQFTSAAIMKLVEAGKIRLDATLGEYLPDYTGPGRRVTIHQLLNHTSGIPSYTSLGAKFWEKNSRLDLTHAEMLALFANDSLQFEPGSRHLYNNSGYYLLGMIIEKVTGQSYSEHLHATITRAHNLAGTMYCDERSIIPHRVEGYEVANGAVVNATPLSMNLPYAAGSVCSTPRDLVRWNHLLVNGRIVSPASYARMTSPTTLSTGVTAPYGYGLAPGRLGTVASVVHSGGINGFNAFMAYYPEPLLTVVVLTNSGEGDPGVITAAIARFVLGIAPPPPPAPVKDLPLNATELARYFGTYDLAPVPLKLRVFEQGGKLHAQATGQGAFPLRYQGDNAFVGPDGTSIRIVFALAADRATQLTITQGGQSTVGRREPE